MTTVDVPPKAGSREWIGLAVLCLPTMLTTIDLNVMFLALPHVSADLEATGTQQLWIADIYGFLIAGFLITMGTVGDRIGRRRLLLIGAAAFIVVSLAAAYATSPGMLITARALIGIAGATVMPTVLATIRMMFKDPKQMSVAMAVWGTSLTAGVVLGPVIGGLLLGAFWWGSIFLMAIPIMGLVLVLGPFLIPETRNPDPGRLDLISVVLSLAGILPVIFALKELAINGWRPLPIVVGVLGLVFLTIFVQRQRTLANPLLDLSLFRHRVLSSALLTGAGVAFVSSGIGLMAALYMQMVEGLSPTRVGLLLLIPALASVFVGNMAPFVARKVRPGQVLAVGMLVSAIGMAVITQVNVSAGLAVLLAGLIIVLVGNGPIGSLIPFMVLSSAPREKAGSAASLPGTVGEFGVALGVAVLGLIGTTVYRNQVAIPDSLPPDAADTAHESIAGAVATANQVGGPAGGALLDSARDAFASGINVVALVGGIVFVGLALLTAIGLRHVEPIGAMVMPGMESPAEEAAPQPSEAADQEPAPEPTIRTDGAST